MAEPALKQAIPVIGYIRVSRVGGRSGDSFISPTEQRNHINELARRKDRPLKVVEWLEELDESGGDGSRPLWNQAIEACERKEVRGIAVWNLRRFSRSIKDAVVSLERIEAAGAQVYSATEDFDTSTTSGRTMRNMIFVMAQDELERARDSFAMSTRNAIERGVWIAAKVPFGYLKDEQTKRLIPDPETAWIVVEIFERKARRESTATIRRWLESLGFPMSTSGLNHLVRNEAYLGVSRQGDVRNEQAHNPLVTRDLFYRAKSACGIPPARTGVLSKLGMLKGIVRCGGCGGAMVVCTSRGARAADGRRVRVPVYQCYGRNKGGCPARSYVHVEELDDFVDRFVLSTLAKEGPVAELVEANQRIEETAQTLAEAERVVSDLLSSTRLVASLGVDEYAAMIEDAKARVELARADHANAQNASAAIEGFAFEGSMLKAWPTLAAEQKRKILHGFLSRVVVTPSRGKKRVPISQRVQIVDRSNVCFDLREVADELVIEVDGETFVATPGESEETQAVASELTRTLFATGRLKVKLDDLTKKARREAWREFVEDSLELAR